MAELGKEVSKCYGALGVGVWLSAAVHYCLEAVRDHVQVFKESGQLSPSERALGSGADAKAYDRAVHFHRGFEDLNAFDFAGWRMTR
jgi:hypothetical protein